MVRRFVEQQHVRILRERAGNRGAAAFSARGAARGAAHVDAKLVGDRCDGVVLGRVRRRS
jgi:hypothetical protein